MEPDTTLEVKLLSDTAKIPTRGTSYSAGYDLYASEDSIIEARQRGVVKTDV